MSASTRRAAKGSLPAVRCLPRCESQGLYLGSIMPFVNICQKWYPSLPRSLLPSCPPYPSNMYGPRMTIKTSHAKNVSHGNEKSWIWPKSDCSLFFELLPLPLLPSTKDKDSNPQRSSFIRQSMLFGEICVHPPDR